MFFQFGPEVGYKTLTVTGVVGDSGKAQALYGYELKCVAAAGQMTLFDGTTGAAPSIAVMDQIGSSSTIFTNFGAAVVFPNGLFASFDGNVTKASFFIRQV